MGKSDIIMKNWLKKPERFADLFNHFLFAGEQVIDPGDLADIDRENDFLYTDKDGRQKALLRHRDLAKLWNERYILSVLACEIQDKIHYAMPLRCMVSDGITYVEQMQLIWQEKSEEEKRDTLSSSEYFSRFSKNDHLYPVLTIVFYYADEKWDGPTDLHGMFLSNLGGSKGDKYRKFLTLIPNYPIHLIDVYHLQEQDEKNPYATDLQMIFEMLKYRKEKVSFQRYIREHADFFRRLDRESMHAIGVLLHSQKLVDRIEKEGEKMTGKEDERMWALDEILLEEHEKGMAEGMEKGRSEGEAAGMSSMVFFMLNKGMKPEEVRNCTPVDDEAFKSILEQYRKKKEQR